MKQEFELEMQVRDYECDLQGIVNNSVYQNYLEHARHEYLKEVGINFSALFKEGIAAVVVKAELEYKDSLYPDDVFVIKTQVKKEKHIRIVFYQEIHRLTDHKLCLKAKVTSVLVQHGKPIVPTMFDLETSE